MGSAQEDAPGADAPLPGNYVPEACKGCVSVHGSHPLILGTVAADSDEEQFQWDPRTKVFAVANAHDYPCFTFLTFSGVQMRDRRGRAFATGVNRNEEGEEERVTTFVLVVKPRTAVRLGRGQVSSGDCFALELERLMEHPRPSLLPGEEAPPAFGFPLPASAGPYLCTQGVGGHLTHFFPESYHAVDLRCDCHTPVLSIGDGVVHEVAEKHKCGGIHAGNLSRWNSVSVRLSCGLIVEYLHTLPGTARVQPGDQVQCGQVLCESGDIGFAPEPHVHIELHSGDNPTGPSVLLRFGSGGEPFVPQAGRWYMPHGEVPAPPRPAESADGDRPQPPRDGGLDADVPEPPPAPVAARGRGGRSRDAGVKRKLAKAEDAMSGSCCDDCAASASESPS